MAAGHVDESGGRLWYEAVGRRFRTLRYDMRGFGRSGREEGAYSRVDVAHLPNLERPKEFAQRVSEFLS